MLLLAGTLTAAIAQPRPCSTIHPAEREFARAIGACRDIAPIIDVAPKGAETAPPVVIPVPHVVGLSFDDARARLARFKLQRSYRPSAEPGGTVLAQQPAPPARLPAGFPVTVVLSDGTLGPAPRVSASDIDEAPNPQATKPDLRPQPSVVTNDGPTGQVIEKSPAATVVQPQSKAPAGPAEVERLRVPNVIGMPIKNAQARLSRFKVERSDRPSDAPIGRVIEQIPKASARTAAGSAIVLVVSSGPAPVTETFELPNVIDRSYADASIALAEFKVDRIEMASAAPSGQVLAQDPAPGTS
ncbi:MAG TPA: PASTA domain-containing protein, partial [Burkholderiaceae bacterium]|nr:PASTA domain-containing protein [Burkholderiaceae bacterium]